VAHAELLSRIAEHDIGLASEVPHTRSRALTITNKILLYLLAGVAVVASDTEGQKEVAGAAKDAVFLYSRDSAADYAKVLDRLLSDAMLRSRARKDAVDAAKNSFSWRHSAGVLVAGVENGLLAPLGQSRILRRYGR
jgi:glycosyltransferase involved in cell wall biosynthesis